MYKAGNLSDQFKHSLLELFIEKTNPVNYVDFHACKGIYPLDECHEYHTAGSTKPYEGSSIRVLKFLKSNKGLTRAFLHEKDIGRRLELEKNTSHFNTRFNHVNIRSKWQNYLDEYVNRNHDSFVFMFDPFSAVDYNNGLLKALNKLLANHEDKLLANHDFFLFLPQKIHIRSNKGVVAKVYTLLKKNKRCFVDFKNPAQTGYYERIDHNLVVTNKLGDFKVLIQRYENIFSVFKDKVKSLQNFNKPKHYYKYTI